MWFFFHLNLIKSFLSNRKNEGRSERARLCLVFIFSVSSFMFSVYVLYRDQFRLDIEITSDLGEDRICHCGFLNQI